MRRFEPPTVHFRDAVFPAEELSGLASGWLEFLRETISPTSRSTAIVLPNHPHSIALLFALSTFPLPVVVLGPDPRSWRSSPPVPPGTPLFLPPALQHLADHGASIGLDVRVVPAPRPPSYSVPAPSFLTSPGLVMFTSGSKAWPRWSAASAETRSFPAVDS